MFGFGISWIQGVWGIFSMTLGYVIYGLGCVGSGDNVGVFRVWMLIGSQGCGVCGVLGDTWGLMDR